ncbi:MAG TPA: hypothetical protein VKC60_06030 [Opitutaceae bacterium]|nr:hypothetical protein [Opitutaceae bacterium]
MSNGASALSSAKDQGEAKLRRRTRCEFIAIFGSAAIIIALYFWTASSMGYFYRLNYRGHDYYDRLVDGFLSGHLSMAVSPAPELLKLADPYDPEANQPFRLNDASYYQGKYYLYFGLTPAVVLLLPWKLITGHHLAQYWASAFFCSVGYLATLGLIWRIRRVSFPQVSLGSLFAINLLLGLTNYCPVLLRRASVWELPIATAYAFMALALWCIYETTLRAKGSHWLTLASLCCGLAFAARPTYALGSIILLMPVLIGRPKSGYRWRQMMLLGAQIALPLAAVGMVVSSYNYLRFGSIFEFGVKYQLITTDLRITPSFGWHFIPFNLQLYFLAPAHLSPYFPFFKIASAPAAPDGQFGIEEMYGLLPNIPILLLCLWAIPSATNKNHVDGISLRVIVAAAVSIFLLTGGIIMVFAGAASRYLVDILVGLNPLVGIALLSVTANSELSRRPPWMLRTLLFLLGTYSALFVLCASFQHKEMFRQSNPATYGALAHWADKPSDWYARLTHKPYGPLDLTVRFRPQPAGAVEPLVVTGWWPYRDLLYVRYLDESKISLGFFNGLQRSWQTQPLPIDFALPHTLHVSMGSLYPPREHPYFDWDERVDIADLISRLEVTMDGQTYFREQITFNDATAFFPSVGNDPKSNDWRFSGEILRIDRKEFSKK